MDESIVYLDRSWIRTEDIGGLRRALEDLATLVNEGQPQLLFYAFEIDADKRAMSVVAVHPDSASLERHLRMGGPAFQAVGAFIELRSIDVYGAASPAVEDLLHEKAQRLGRDATVAIHDLPIGFSRLARTSAPA